MGCPELHARDWFRFVGPDGPDCTRTHPQEKNRYKPVFHTVISNYRYYSPELGRWLSRDPIGEAAFFRNYSKNKNIQEIRRLWEDYIISGYLFVSNNPNNNVDLIGLGFWSDVWSGTKTVAGATPVLGTIINAATTPPGADPSDYEECKGENPECTNCIKKLEVEYVGRYMASYLLHGAGDVAMIAGGAASAKYSFGASLGFVVVGELDGIGNAFVYVAKVEDIWEAAEEAISIYCCDPPK